MARSFGESFAKTFTPAWKESYQFTAAELAEEEKDRKQKNRLKRAGEAKFETILGMTPPEIVTEVASTLPASKDTGDKLIPVLDDPIGRIRQAVASQKGRMGKAAMQSAITSKLLSRASFSQGIKDYDLKATHIEKREKSKVNKALRKGLNEWNESNRINFRPNVQEGGREPLLNLPPLPRGESQDIEDDRILKKGDPRKLHSIPVRPQMPSNLDDYINKGYIDEDGNYTMKWMRRMNGNRDNMIMFKDLTEHHGSFPTINSLGTAKMKGNFSNMLKQINQEMTNDDKGILLTLQGMAMGQPTELTSPEEDTLTQEEKDEKRDKFMRAIAIDPSNTPEENAQARRIMSAHALWLKGYELEKYARESATGVANEGRRAEVKRLYSEAALYSSETSTKKHDGEPIWILTPAQKQTADGLAVTVMVPRFHPEYSPTVTDIKAANDRANELLNKMNDLGNATVGNKGEMEFPNKSGTGANTVRYERFKNTK